ncbi:MAG TPA: hypothetical protein VGE27_07005 [Gemmatimonas sp.]|uniref:hypothetical protein n=1 Tax=Gemmatimonas sp. TaxID=1962908 RepID=UPI002ED8EAFA
MTGNERVSGSARRSRRCTGSASAAERILLALGVDQSFAEAVLGDLAEEYAERATFGVRAARQWYAGQMIRSAPYLIRSAGRHAAGRARLAAAVASLSLVASVILFARTARNGPPVRLVAGTGDTILVNFLRPVSLSIRVLDADGRLLPDSGVRYAWIGGAPVSVSERGIVTCAHSGDAKVRASLGSLATTLHLLCRPVRAVSAGFWADFVLGESGRDLDVTAVDVDGRLATRLGARLSVEDSTVAVLSGLRVEPRSPGETRASLRVGDRTTDFFVRVFEPVSTLE